jgi:hypothetical protein
MSLWAIGNGKIRMFMRTAPRGASTDDAWLLSTTSGMSEHPAWKHPVCSAFRIPTCQSRGNVSNSEVIGYLV